MHFLQARLESDTENVWISYAEWKKFYTKYLQTQYWKKKRKWFMELWNYTCPCGRKATQVHHWKIGYLNLWQETWKDCIPLCGWCHRKMHNLVEPKTKVRLEKNDYVVNYEQIKVASSKLERRIVEKRINQTQINFELPNISLVSKKKKRDIINA